MKLQLVYKIQSEDMRNAVVPSYKEIWISASDVGWYINNSTYIVTDQIKEFKVVIEKRVLVNE